MTDLVSVYSTPLREESSSNGAAPTDGGSTDEPIDETGPTDEDPGDGPVPNNGGGPIEGPMEEVPGPTGDGENRTQFQEYTCFNGRGAGTCSCGGADDCVKMVLDGVCKDGTWKGDVNGGECQWK